MRSRHHLPASPLPPGLARHRRQRGVTVILALALLVFLGAVFVALAARFANDARRTRHAHTDAQTRQLFLAAQQLAARALAGSPAGAIEPRTYSHRAADHDDRPFTIRITPFSLTDFGGTGSIVLHATVTTDDRTAVQQLTYARADGRWTLVDAAVIRAR